MFVGLGGVATVWDARRGVVREARTLVPSRAGAVALSPDGARAAFTLPDGSVEIWNLLSWQRLAKVGVLGRRIGHLGFDPSGLRLAVKMNGEGLSLWDGQTGREISFLKGDHRPLVFTPAGKKLCLASGSGWMTWEPATREEMLSLAKQAAGVSQLQFSPDGKALAAGFGGAEGPINLQIWHAD